MRSRNRHQGRLLADDAGLTLIELMIALFVLVVGILGTFGTFASSKHAASIAQAEETEIHQAQRELERLQSLPYENLALNGTPATSANVHNPGHYVSSGACPTFTWNQTSGAESAEPLILNTCEYPIEKAEGLVNVKPQGTVSPTASWTAGNLSGTIYDYITWVTDPNCNPKNGCPSQYDYKRVTVEVTNSSSKAPFTPTTPVLASAIVTDPKALPLKGTPKSANPLESTEIKCTNGHNEIVKCNYGIGNQTPHTWYLTDSPAELGEAGYLSPTADNSCLHYTTALDPSPRCTGTAAAGNCSLLTTTYTTCPQLDLLNISAPAAEKEWDFSPSLLTPNKEGRVIRRDAARSSCTGEPSSSATEGIWWATPPQEKLKLSGNGGLTLYTRTFGSTAAQVTMCVGVYQENPVLDASCKAVLGPSGKALLDPLNLLNSTCTTSSARKDSELLGTVSVTKEVWPTEITPVSFTFNYASAKELPAGSSIALRLWATSGSGDDIVALYDAQAVRSTVQINSE